ncbi:tRNA (5-methylaminomethyl-2-thiouridylate)-methyltransferase [Candidatus Glomeribacter gigasporarum BEG34]|uniref:tRNA-specific 2-thiouridylase MnmA n=1 Tax=Candidatus Glomeribacter gigasporarum BEG34 TaxID=1070319 RepID=G2JB85_9BURK|nr:tRNA 2-thiouridine(34) synthase MnmA [Candidatus Glomeribacter gigasporarum]CCD30038.1 tRNA (5-methylaminomethyl-2-thiouridylate)-methyltransferase [Candidatus Glomeribacter gigasporarum BEG34]
MKKRIIVGMSGGVDSSVSAWLLKQQGHEVMGLFMKNWEEEAHCAARQDWIDAASVADLLGMDIEVANFAAEYKAQVFAEFLREHAAGRTPNPDVLCNARIKFKAFVEHALALGAQMIATGHYARIHRPAQGGIELRRACDSTKDQSYFLHRLNQAQLARVCFPLGAMQKAQVRAIAARIGLPNAAKKDSTGICFIGERPFRDFLSRYLPRAPGPIKTPDGQTVGEHIGMAFYTLGQRKGIGLGGIRNGNGAPWYVARKDSAQNTLYVVQGHTHPWLNRDSIDLENARWISGAPPPDGFRCSAKTRYRQTDAPCTLIRTHENRFTLHFDQPQWAATPGQYAVLYHGERCIGGGVIT